MSSPQDANNPLLRNNSQTSGTTTTTTNLMKHATVQHVTNDGKRSEPRFISAGTHAQSKFNTTNNNNDNNISVGKVQLGAGYSQMDWMRLTKRTDANLNGLSESEEEKFGEEEEEEENDKRHKTSDYIRRA